MSTMLICLIFRWRMSLRAAGYRGASGDTWPTLDGRAVNQRVTNKVGLEIFLSLGTGILQRQVIKVGREGTKVLLVTPRHREEVDMRFCVNLPAFQDDWCCATKRRTWYFKNRGKKEQKSEEAFQDYNKTKYLTFQLSAYSASNENKNNKLKRGWELTKELQRIKEK